MSELRAEGLEIALGHSFRLTGISLVARAGTWFTITGPSGSGKSVLLQILAGLIRPDRGEVLLDGQPAWREGNGLQPAFVPQDYALVPILTALETVALPLQVKALPRSEVRARAREWLDRLGLAGTADRLVGNLSGGQRQRVAIARALAVDSPLLLVDEPTTELDAGNRGIVLELLHERVKAGSILIAVSHEPTVLELSQQIATLRPGGEFSLQSSN